MHAALAQEAPTGRSEPPTSRAWYALTVLILAALFGAVDRQILVLVTEPLKQEMHLADVQIGVLQGVGPGLFGAVGAVVLGWLADRTARQILLALCILAWSAATAACGLAQTFGHLLAATVAIALGETAIGPVFYSMVPDLFPGKSRVTANLIFFAAVTVGGGFGYTLAGSALPWIAAHRTALPLELRELSPWRLAFFDLALPGVPIAIAVLAIGPVRRMARMIASRDVVGPMARYVREHGRALGCLFTAVSFFVVAQYAAYAWTPVYIVRVLGGSPEEVGAGVGAAATIGSIAGVGLAAAGAKRLTSRFGALTSVRLLEGAIAAYLIPVVLQLSVQRPWHAYLLMGMQAVTGTAAVALLPTLWQDISPATIRARVIALGTVFTSVAVAAAPVLVGAVSDALSRYPRGLLWAVVLVSAPAAAAAVLLLTLSDQAIRRTIEALAPGTPP